MERDPSKDILLKAGVVCILIFLTAVVIWIFNQ